MKSVVEVDRAEREHYFILCNIVISVEKMLIPPLEKCPSWLLGLLLGTKARHAAEWRDAFVQEIKRARQSLDKRA